ncbi:MAG: hypothetical protein AB1758_04545 [Candidatus Eremiobacterota bacterium]
MSEGLSQVYRSIAELWCSPCDVDLQEASRSARAAATGWKATNPEGAESLSRFLEGLPTEEEYIDLFELDPRCSLYLGSNVFAEPESCAKAGVCDRNAYMLELVGIYRHFGLMPNGRDLPDYLPQVVDFLGLSWASNDPMRDKAVREYVLPYLPPIRSRLEELGSAYTHLLDALERALQQDLQSRPEADPELGTEQLEMEASHG